MPSPELPDSTYSEQTKQRIVDFVRENPGLKGREIAERLGLDKPRVNSFLYGQGKRIHDLIVEDYCWYPPVHQPKPAPSPPYPRSPVQQPEPVPTREIPQTSICGSLAAMGQTQATIKIRGMGLEAVELAFQEDDYGLLDDFCKAELVTRSSVLLKRSPTKESKPFNILPLLLSIVACFVVFSIFIARNGQRNTPAPTPLPADVNR